MYDITIIGGGAAGMSAALYAGRGGAKTLILEKLGYGGQAARTAEIENYPGFAEKLSGEELSGKMEEHARKFGAEFIKENVREIINPEADTKLIKTRRSSYQTKTIIFATGAEPKKLGVPGEEKYAGMGVSYCATCDGAFFRGKDVIVVGGGNTAFADALYLSALCENVFVLNRSERFRAAKTIVERAEQKENITIYKNMIVTKFEGQNTLEEAYVKNVATGEEGFIKASGAIIAVGIVPYSELAEKCGIALCPDKFIKTDEFMATNIPGIYAAGDVRTSPLRQIVTAAADGAVAATSAINYINGRK